MTDRPREQRLLPIACTLGPIDGAERVADWRRLSEASGLGRLTSNGNVTLRFADDGGVAEALAELVNSERLCCAFLDWQLSKHDAEWHVVISGDDDQLAALSFSR